MKKLLVLMLVLGMASMATAGLSFATSSATILVGGTTTVGLTTDVAVAGGSLTNIVGYYAGSVASLSVAGGAAVTPGMDTVNAQAAPYVGYFQTIMGTTTAGGFLLDDEIVSATLTGLSAGTYTIYVYDGASWTSPPGPTGSFTLTVNAIPEPMTIGLLGLGGLFLRRRK